MKIAAGVLAAGAAFLGSASAVPDEDALDRFDRTGETVKCVNMRGTDITPIDESRLLFRVGANDYYLNETRGQCNDIDSNFTRIEVKLFGSQICSGEIIRVVNQAGGVFQGACSLGDFEKLTKKPAAGDTAD